MRFAVATCLAAALFIAFASLGDAKVRSLGVVDRDVPRPVSDGVRYLAYKTAPASLRILDTKTAGRRDVTVGEGCDVEDIYAATVLLRCGDVNSTYPLVSARTGAMQLAPAPPSTFVKYHFIGRYWLGGTECRGRCVLSYLNRANGEVRPSGTRLDINTVDLRVYDPRLYPSLQRVGPNRHKLYYRFAGLRSRRVLIRTCPGGHNCIDNALALSDRAVWSEHAHVYGLILRTRRRCTWRLPTSPRGGLFGLDLLSTPYALVAAITEGAKFTGTIYKASWRGC